MAKMSKGKRRLIFSAVMLGFLLLLLEGISMVGLRVLDRKLGVDQKLQLIQKGMSRRLLASGADPSTTVEMPRMRFDADLGWDTVAGVRQGGRAKQGQRYFAAAYGDSFTYCDEVREDQSWQHYFKKQTGKTILNLGVNAYGTDQALLKLRKYQEHYPARVVIMGLMSDDIGRTGGIIGSFYLATPMVSVKPRFVFQPDGSLRLMQNPVRDEAGLARLSNVEQLARIAQNDYWYQVYKRRYGVDLLRGRGFPALLDLAILVSGVSQYGLEPMDRYYFLRHPDEEPMRITKRVLRRFAQRVREAQGKPVLVLHYDASDLKRHALLEPLKWYVHRELKMPIFDVRQVLLEELNAKRVSQTELFMPGHHYTARGNQIIARGLARFFKDQGLL